MGGNCGKGSKTHDPDKTPYGPAKSSDLPESDAKGRKKSKGGSKKDKKRKDEQVVTTDTTREQVNKLSM